MDSIKKTEVTTGQKYGRLTAIAPTGRRGYNGEYWVCVCSCGTVKEIMAFDLRSGRVKSCGCGQHPHGDYTGVRRGDLIGVRKTDKTVDHYGMKRPVWEWRCKCGRIVEKAVYEVAPGKSTCCPECAREKKRETARLNNLKSRVDGTNMSKSQLRGVLEGRLTSRNRSGIRGVSWAKNANKWTARGFKDGKPVHLGYIRFTSAGTYQYKITELDPATADISAYSAVADVTGYGVEKTITIVVDDSLKVTSVNGTDTTYSDNTVNTTFTNTKTTGILIQLLKLGDGSFDHPLNGVTFELYEDQACTKQITEDGFGTPIGTNGVITTNSNGMADIGMLKAGTYYLKETGTVDGYNLLTETIKIVVGSDLTVTYTQSSFNNSNKGPDLVYTDAEGDQDQYFYYSKIRGDETDTYARNDEYKFVGYRIVVSNQSGVELPATGGTGTALFTALGGLMTATAGAILTLTAYRRRKQHA